MCFIKILWTKKLANIHKSVVTTQNNYTVFYGRAFSNVFAVSMKINHSDEFSSLKIWDQTVWTMRLYKVNNNEKKIWTFTFYTIINKIDVNHSLGTFWQKLCNIAIKFKTHIIARVFKGSNFISQLVVQMCAHKIIPQFVDQMVTPIPICVSLPKRLVKPTQDWLQHMQGNVQVGNNMYDKITYFYLNSYSCTIFLLNWCS